MQREEFEKRATRLRSLIMKVGWQYFGNREDAEDVAQEVMLHLWTQLGDIDPHRGSAEGLAIRMAKSYCIDRLRHREISTEPLATEHQHVTEETAETQMESNEMQAWLNRRIEALPASWRRLLKMNQENGLTPREIACLTGLKEKSVSVMLSAARKRLIDETRKTWKI